MLPGREIAPEGPQISESRDPSLTRPTGPPDNQPTGQPFRNDEGATPANKAQVDSEIRMGRSLAIRGYRTVQNPTEGPNPPLTPKRMREEGLDQEKHPDFLVENRVYDGYTPVEDDARSVRDGIARKIGNRQTHRVIVDLTGTTQTEASVRAALRAAPVPGLREVMILTKDGLGQPFRP